MHRISKATVAAAAATIAAGLAGTACAQTLEWTSGQVGGGWYTMASGMAKLIMDENPDLTIKVVPGGGTTNPSKVQRGSALGMGLDIFTFAARKGQGLYEGKPHDKLMMIGKSFSDNYIHFLRGSDAKQGFEGFFADGDGLSVAVTKVGSSTEKTFSYVMDYYGESYETLRDERDYKINHGDYSEISSQYKDGQVDYAFMALGLPGAAVIDMMLARDSELVPIPEELASHLKETYGYAVRPIPADTYEGQSDDVSTVVMGTTLMVNADVPEEAVYKITKTLCENQDQLVAIHASMAAYDCRTAAQDPPAPIHPGAARYYEEQGYM